VAVPLQTPPQETGVELLFGTITLLGMIMKAMVVSQLLASLSLTV
jgi:hypothetical protein